MKNRNLAKILTLVLSLALLIGSVAAINVSAETDEIAGVSIVHGAKIQIAIAADADAIVTYKWGAEGETLTAKKGDVIVSANAAVNGKTAYLTEGVAYYELGKVAYITVNGEEITYSVAQFLFAQLYRDKVTGDAKTCYEALLALGDASQVHLDKNADALPSDSTYVYTKNADITINNDNFAFAPTGSEATVTLAYNGTEEYTGFQIGNKVVAKNKAANIKVAGVSEVVLYTDEISGYGMDFESSVTEGVNLYTQSGGHQTSINVGENYAPTSANGVVGNIVNVDKGNGDVSNVLKIVVNGNKTNNTGGSSLGGQPTIAITKTDDDGGAYHVMEYDFNWATAAKTGWRNPWTIEAFDASGNSLGLLTNNPDGTTDGQYNVNMINNGVYGAGATFTEGTVVADAYQLGISGKQSETGEGNYLLLDSDTWYRIRWIWNEDTGETWYSVSYDGGETWNKACKDANTSNKLVTTTDVASLKIRFNQFYGYGGTFYFDNINYNVVSELPELPANNGIPKA